MALGTDRGAPIKASLGKKAIATTIIAFVLFAGFYYARVVAGIGLDDFPFLPTY